MGDDVLKIELRDTNISRVLSQLHKILQDTSSVMSDLAEQLAESAKGQFEDEKGPDGSDWERLSSVTISSRTKRGKWPGKILQVSRNLSSSVQVESGNMYAQIGTVSVYGRIHFLGGQAGKGQKVTIPARPYMPFLTDGSIGEPAKNDIVDIMENYFTGAISG